MVIMGALVLLGVGIASIYYNYQNKSIDPRVVKARELYGNYDEFAQTNQFKKVLQLLDSVKQVYAPIAHYNNSYEMGVVYNNQAAVYLTMALHFESNSLSLDGITPLSKDSLLHLSQQAVKKAIRIYEEWLGEFEKIPEDELKMHLQNNFIVGFQGYSAKEKKRFLKKRTKEITDAQLETPRRLSVAYTNLGIVKRHQENYTEAIEYYEKALKLWDRNLAAENNLNMLLGKPLKKRNFIEKLFPPDKKN